MLHSDDCCSDPGKDSVGRVYVPQSMRVVFEQSDSALSVHVYLSRLDFRRCLKCCDGAASCHCSAEEHCVLLNCVDFLIDNFGTVVCNVHFHMEDNI